MDTLNSIRFFIPELILSIGACLLILIDGFIKNKRITSYLALFVLGIAAVFLFISQPTAHSPQPTAMGLFSNMLIFDSLAAFFKFLFIGATVITIALSFSYKQFALKDAGAYNALLVFATLAFILMASACNFLIMYLALEMAGIVCYILVGYLKTDRSSGEGGLKYFLFGAASTGIMLYGISLLYGITGTLNIAECGMRIAELNNQSPILANISLVLILAGIGFKIALVPFHMWAPDAYEGAPTPITAFISVASKTAGFALLLRIMNCITQAQIMNMLEILTILTMTLGNIIAISQTNIKRMLAYSSIAQAGYILIGFIAGTPRGLEGVLMYLLVYLFMNLGAFAVVIAVSNMLNTDRIQDYAGLYRHSGGLALCLTIFLLSLAGIPPLAGFLGKFYIFSAAIESDKIFLAIAGAVNSVIALYYYVGVIRYMYLEEPPASATAINSALSLKIGIAFALIGTLVIGIMPAPFTGGVINAFAR